MSKSVVAAAVYSALSVLAAFGGVLQRWSCETSEISEHEIVAYHGETVEMQCQMLSYGRIVSGCGQAEFLWQTNGMGNAWWVTNATASAGYVKFNWTPWYDTGADNFRFFFRVTDAKGANYRANGTISLLGSPYGDAAYLPLPQKIIDFAKVEVVNPTNAPWMMKGADVVSSNMAVRIASAVVTNDVADWALKPHPAPVTDLTPAIQYTTAVSNKLEGMITADSSRIDTVEGRTNAWNTAVDDVGVIKKDYTTHTAATNAANAAITNAVEDGYVAQPSVTNGLLRASDYHGDYISNGVNVIRSDLTVSISQWWTGVFTNHMVLSEFEVDFEFTSVGEKKWKAENYVSGPDAVILATGDSAETAVYTFYPMGTEYTEYVYELAPPWPYDTGAFGTFSYYRNKNAEILKDSLCVKSSVEAQITNKADKATTLSGYGIINAYTKTEINGMSVTNGGAVAVAEEMFRDAEERFRDKEDREYKFPVILEKYKPYILSGKEFYKLKFVRVPSGMIFLYYYNELKGYWVNASNIRVTENGNLHSWHNDGGTLNGSMPPKGTQIASVRNLIAMDSEIPSVTNILSLAKTDAESITAPVSNVVFSEETYFEIGDMGLNLVSQSNLVFQSAFELTNYWADAETASVTNISIYAGQNARVELGTACTNLVVNLLLPVNPQAMGDAYLRVHCQADSRIGDLTVNGGRNFTEEGMSDWNLMTAGDYWFSFTKSAVTNGVPEIWISRSKSER